MTSLNHAMATFIGIRWNLGIFFALILFGVCFTSSDSRAQAVPPRVQTLQMIRPPAPPPEPPIQKEIRELKQDVQANTRELERLKAVATTISALEKLKIERQTELANLRSQLNQLPANSPQRRPIQLDIDYLTRQIQDIERQISVWRRERSSR